MQKLSMEIDSHLYVAKITNISKNNDITEYIDSCNITLPKANEISSMEANFILDEKLVDTGNEVKIEIIDEVGNILYTLEGMATLEKRNKSYTGNETWTYSIKDSYDKLFDKVVPETMVFFDLFFCNVNDKSNSLLHIVANKLGFREDQVDFKDIIFNDGSLIRVPFVLFEQDERWIDILQRFIKATDSILYIKDKKLFSRQKSFNINEDLRLNKTNIITEIEETFNSNLYNGIRVTYDRFLKLDNRVVFDLSQKIIVDKNKPVGSQDIQSMKISYSTSSVANPILTKATAYYFTREDDVSSKVDISLVKGTHYIVEEWKETQAIVKFFNPYPYKLYIENFEIKGLPLVKYENNESVIKNLNIIEKNQENFVSIQKNREVQTEKLAKHIALCEYKNQILNNKTFNFTTNFLKDIKLGEVYSLELEDINTIVRVTNISISLKPAEFEMKIEADCIENDDDFTYSSTLSGKSNSSFIDLKSLEEKIDENSKNLKVLDRDVRSKLFKQKTEPNLADVKENDIWLNPDTNVWKKFYNGVWNSISETEILPSMKMYNSIDGNIIKLQGTADKVGAYLLNEGEKFGSLNGELAHVTFDKLGQFEAENPNNRVALNIKDPANPSVVTSQILLGVTDITNEKYKDVSFQVGDEATGHYIQFKNNQARVVENGKTITDVNNSLENGDFTITGRTNFDGSARFISRGTNEVITIANGAIDFYRDGKRLTRIKNIRYGTVATNSFGSGVVNFEGFKQPMIVLPTIKSANFGKNMASIFCYAEHLGGVSYRFFIGGTNENYRDANAIKAMGTSWSTNNVFVTTLLGITGYLDGKYYKGSYKELGVNIKKTAKNGERKAVLNVLKVPSFNVKVKRNGEVIFDKNYSININHKELPYRIEYSINPLSIDANFNILKKFTNRTNITYTLEITILESNLEVSGEFYTSHGHDVGKDASGIKYEYYQYSGVIYSINNSSFKNLSITASAETSTISSATGNGEVQYIAMEVD
ncbi:hypothetical protein [Fusobacterium periodonticum]|uniref:Uncharacterized protein n=1 Tax=Fusobacterium periodonticum D10 TaxID=620833 RepID=K1GVK1_9FUSO|nr:hypothetical protein [Fusobacterium periodonticum]EKA93407.1 hypothetical protein FPOG_00312 [Fusobacterium periodonticum D10]